MHASASPLPPVLHIVEGAKTQMPSPAPGVLPSVKAPTLSPASGVVDVVKAQTPTPSSGVLAVAELAKTHNPSPPASPTGGLANGVLANGLVETRQSSPREEGSAEIVPVAGPPTLPQDSPAQAVDEVNPSEPTDMVRVSLLRTHVKLFLCCLTLHKVHCQSATEYIRGLTKVP